MPQKSYAHSRILLCLSVTSFLNNVATAQVTPSGGLTVGKTTYVLGQPAEKALASLRQHTPVIKTHHTIPEGGVGTAFSYYGLELKQDKLDSTLVFFEGGKVVSLIGMKTYKTKGTEANQRTALHFLQTLGVPTYFAAIDTLSNAAPAMAWKKLGAIVFLSLSRRGAKGEDVGYQEIKIAPPTDDVLDKLYGTASVTMEQGQQMVTPLRALVEKQFPGQSKTIPLKLNLPPAPTETANN